MDVDADPKLKGRAAVPALTREWPAAVAAALAEGGGNTVRDVREVPELAAMVLGRKGEEKRTTGRGSVRFDAEIDRCEGFFFFFL